MRHAAALTRADYLLNIRAWEALRRMTGSADGFVLVGVLRVGLVLALVGAGQKDVAQVVTLAGPLLPLTAFASR
ncbi:hypothetical protein OHU17_05265 [Streptomyces goshikiensis]|uniref:Uncharacterized protein n=1 Tax=Streptomyces goshikiensis TaxID=1942 RepID=A0ABZ1REP7_9ACTN|nr:hypothetical protein [Streptomyces goshikiensis]